MILEKGTKVVEEFSFSVLFKIPFSNAVPQCHLPPTCHTAWLNPKYEAIFYSYKITFCKIQRIHWQDQITIETDSTPVGRGCQNLPSVGRKNEYDRHHWIHFLHVMKCVHHLHQTASLNWFLRVKLHIRLDMLFVFACSFFKQSW